MGVSLPRTPAARYAYQLAIKTAESLGDSQAVTDLKKSGPPPYANSSKSEQLFYKWRHACEGVETDRFLGGRLGLTLTAPGNSIRDFNDWLDGQVLSARELTKQQTELEPKRLAGTFTVPVFVLQGAHDCTSPTELATRYIDSIQAPHKEFVVIPGAGQFAVFMQSNEFLKQLVARVHPLVKG
jgi:pimeloyl-ACP methyl ester carboxylesterase